MECSPAELVAAVRSMAAVIEKNEVELTELDRLLGDGDHGANIVRGFRAVLGRLDEERPGTGPGVLRLTGTTLIATVGGASGPLLGTAFLRAAVRLEQAARGAGGIEPIDVAAALDAARRGVVDRGKVGLGDKTMLDAIDPAARAAATAVPSGVAAVLAAAADAARTGAAATGPMLARKGRASYLGEQSVGPADPGACTVAHLLVALAEAVR